MQGETTRIDAQPKILPASPDQGREGTEDLMGCHRWGLRNLIESGWHAVTIVGQITALLVGANPQSLALIYLMGIMLAQMTRMVAA